MGVSDFQKHLFYLYNIEKELVMTPWNSIPLQEYESHMNYPTVGQAQFLAEMMGQLADYLKPNSMAVIGCAGGNGFEEIKQAGVEHLVGIDINKEYGDIAFERFSESFDHLEIITADFTDQSCEFDQVDFLFAGLVFEYIDIESALQKCAEQVVCNGYLAAVMQLPSDLHSKISESPYAGSFDVLNDCMELVDIEQFEKIAHESQFTTLSKESITLDSGKSFLILLLQRN